ncbi:TetR/AcrR family transcriptional regulator [Streptomyces sp. YC504]|uniref:TetR/AcrR family transcriptional regulator n=1 Tax=Streptomyces mesophilus TaxID=1775132 RepID=A0A6G4XSU8_9ACTN|nr:TetR/AcrR family transcriptional regulator [Streptomyces mesophilus]NGO80282.1 TetR/AcrR family transcriptional regulator [Streptomyces mesophilus]
MGRRKDQQARRTELAAAAERALLSRGLEGLRLRDVADEAGMTPAAVLYYYDGGLDQLMHETFQQAIERFCSERERTAEEFEDARDRMRSCITSGVAIGSDDRLPRLLFEYWPRSLRDPRAAALDSTLTERQIAVYHSILVLGREQGHFKPVTPPRVVAACLVAMEDGFQMEILAGRRTHAEVISALRAYVHAVTGCDLDANGPGVG